MNEIEDILSRIENWGADQSNFDMTFIESCREQFDASGDLSIRQVAALENIIDKWGIE